MGIFAHEMDSGAPAQPNKCANTWVFAHLLPQMGEICVKWPDSHIFWPKTGKYVRNGAFYTFTGEIPGQARNDGKASPEWGGQARLTGCGRPFDKHRDRPLDKLRDRPLGKFRDRPLDKLRDRPIDRTFPPPRPNRQSPREPRGARGGGFGSRGSRRAPRRRRSGGA